MCKILHGALITQTKKDVCFLYQIDGRHRFSKRTMVIVQAFTFQTPFAPRLIRLKRAITLSSPNTNRTSSIVRNDGVKVGLIHASRSSESWAHKHVPMSPTTGPVTIPTNVSKYDNTLSSYTKFNLTVGTHHLFFLCWCWSPTESLLYRHPYLHKFKHHVHYRTLFPSWYRFKNSLTHLEITHENRWKLQINFYTQIDSYIELATHFRLERLKFVSLQQSNQSLSIFSFLANVIDLKID